MSLLSKFPTASTSVQDMRYRSLCDLAPMSLQIFSLNGDCTYVNSAWEKHFCARREDLIGYNLFNDPQLSEKGITALIRSAMKGDVVHIPPHEFVPEASGLVGRARWQEVHMYPVRNHEGTISEVAIVAVDLTEVMVAHRLTENSQKKLREAVAVRDVFFSIASHELRTPVTTMKLQTQLLRRRASRGQNLDSDQVIKVVEQIEKSVDRLTVLIGDMLDSSRIQTGKLSLSSDWMDLGNLTREVLERFHYPLLAAGMPLQLECENDVRGKWDRHRLDQVISNVVTNAIRYAAGTQLYVQLTKKRTEAELVIRDRGPGIAVENQYKIFERFERVVPAEKISGLGVGLFIARDIIEGHGGTIHVESEVGQGAKFVIRLPIKLV